MEYEPNKIKIITITFSCLILIVIISAYIFNLLSKVNTGLDVVTAPVDVSIQIQKVDDIDNKLKNLKLSNTKNLIKLEPGKYNLVFSSDNFDKKTVKDIEVHKNELTRISLIMNPNNDIGKRIAEEEIFLRQSEFVWSRLALEAEKSFTREYPFSKNLPIYDKYLEINMCRGLEGNDDMGFCVVLYLDSPDQRSDALYHISQLGEEASKLPVYWKN